MQATGGAHGIIAEAVNLGNEEALPIETPGNRLPATPTQIEGQGDHRCPKIQTHNIAEASS